MKDAEDSPAARTVDSDRLWTMLMDRIDRLETENREQMKMLLALSAQLASTKTSVTIYATITAGVVSLGLTALVEIVVRMH